jgi:glycosyltransferase involved in cell wall biosynthesis
MTNPRVAVLLPCYNPGPELQETLDSLSMQSVPFKLFVVDDGSQRRPDYASLLKPFEHHLIQLPKNIGVNEVRNPAIRQILKEGFKFIALIDCGDIATPNRLERQLHELDKQPDIDILGSAIHQVFAVSGREFILPFPHSPSDVESTSWAKLPISHPTLMLRSDVFRKIGMYSAKYEAAEDYELIRRAIASGIKVANLPDVLLKKIETRESISHKKRKVQLSSRLAIQWHYRSLLNPRCVAGMLRTYVIRMMRQEWIDAVKKPLIGAKDVRAT